MSSFKHVVERIGLLGVAVALAAGCGSRLTDTGYVGTWQRGQGSSTISLKPEADGYRFRWSMRDGMRTVLCDEQGLCEETQEGKKAYEYRFRVFQREGSQDLFIECQGTPIDPRMDAVHYIDKLTLQPGGMELWTVMIELDGKPLDPPSQPLKFKKTSDVPF